MKKILKIILGIVPFLLIPAGFGGVGAGVYLGIIYPQIEAEKILKNGIVTTATIVGLNSNVTASSSSGSVLRTDRYYYLNLTFINSERNEILYKTRSIYPGEFIRKYHIEKGNTVQAVYLGPKAVVRGYVPKYETWLWLFPVIFGAIAAGFLIIPVISIVWITNDNIIKKFGAQATGKYLEHKKLIKTNGPDLNSITCVYKNDSDEIIEVHTRFIYSFSEAEEFAKMKTFPIIYRGKKAVIMIDKKQTDYKQSP